MDSHKFEFTPISLTIKDAARRLVVCSMTIRRLLDGGALKRVSARRFVRVLTRSVQELAKRGGVSHAK